MFQIFENAWTHNDLEWFYQDMQKIKQTERSQSSDDPNYKDPDSLRWKCEKNTESRNQLEEKISKLLPKHQINFAAYVEQHKPNKLHCDSYGGPFGVTCIIPLLKYKNDTDQTLVFDYLSVESDNTNSILDKLQQETEKNIPKFRHTKKYKLNHCNPSKNILKNPVDWISLLGVFPYQYQNMVAFDKRLLHCSNDWLSTDPTRQHKDFIIIHTYAKY
jgi:hypothetical protein